ncbi:MAG: hypothetical protein KC621_06425 [Myxococcales bacterium]|nr:hypothetical protein [Myxococcales bacterium]
MTPAFEVPAREIREELGPSTTAEGRVVRTCSVYEALVVQVTMDPGLMGWVSAGLTPTKPGEGPEAACARAGASALALGERQIPTVWGVLGPWLFVRQADGHGVAADVTVVDGAGKAAWRGFVALDEPIAVDAKGTLTFGWVPGHCATSELATCWAGLRQPSWPVEVPACAAGPSEVVDWVVPARIDDLAKPAAVPVGVFRCVPQP